MDNLVVDRARVSSRLDVAPARLRSKSPSGRGRGLRYDAVARSTGPGGAVPQIRSCHLAIDLATDQCLTPA
jgi:hypothetical protein